MRKFYEGGIQPAMKDVLFVVVRRGGVSSFGFPKCQVSPRVGRGGNASRRE
jgi:hypothetical protein